MHKPHLIIPIIRKIPLLPYQPPPLPFQPSDLHPSIPLSFKPSLSQPFSVPTHPHSPLPSPTSHLTAAQNDGDLQILQREITNQILVSPLCRN